VKPETDIYYDKSAAKAIEAWNTRATIPRSNPIGMMAMPAEEFERHLINECLDTWDVGYVTENAMAFEIYHNKMADLIKQRDEAIRQEARNAALEEAALKIDARLDQIKNNPPCVTGSVLTHLQWEIRALKANP